MAITINKSDGEELVVIQDGVNEISATSISLLGRNFIGYSDKIATNFVHMLEHFAANVAPSAPLTGQIWYDTDNSVLNVYEDGIGWKTLASSAASATAPANPLIGDLWFDTNNQQLKAWTGAEWLVIGPSTPSGFGFTGIQVETINDTLAAPHTIGKEFVDGNLIAIISQDAEFAPANITISTLFGNLKPGYNLTSNLPAKYWNGIASNSDRLNNLPSTSFLRANVPALTTSSLTVQSDTGLTIGLGLDATINVTNDIDVNIKNNSSGGNITLLSSNTAAFTVNTANNLELLASSQYSANLVANANAFSSTALVTKGYVDVAVGGGSDVLLKDGTNQITGTITPDLTLLRNFGSASLRFATIWMGNANVSAAITGASLTSQTGNFTATTQSSNTTTGAVVISGGVGVASNVHIGGNLVVSQRAIISGNITSQSLLPATSNTHDLGTAGNTYRSMYANAFVGTASFAQYADLAEIYTSDGYYEPGTVVIFGGSEEITISSTHANTAVAGVISEKPGFLMNTHEVGLPVALRGKVKCFVTGEVRKGDMLVSSMTPGVACVTKTYVGGAIIGKALENADLGGSIGSINVAVGSI